MSWARVACLVSLVAVPALAQSARIVLRWRDVPGATAYELQIARDSTFVEVVLQTRTPTAGYKWDQLPSATHWWRVRSFDSDGRPSEWSAPKTIAVDSVVPEVKRPAEGAVVACGGAVEVELGSSPLIKEYQVELASNAAFTSARELKSPAPVLTVGALPAGAWFLRARALDLKGKVVGPGPARSFFVRASAPRPKPVGEVTLGVPQVQLAWSEVACAKSWLVEVVNDAREKTSLPARELSLAFKPGQAGDYRWRVAAVDENGTAGEWSAEVPLRVKLPAPVTKAEVVTTHAELGWASVSTATSYRVELFLGGEAVGKPKLVTQGPGTQWRTVDLEAGRYAWRVQAKDARGHVSAFSEVHVFERRALTPLPEVALHAVEDVALGAPLGLSWDASAGAAQYEVVVDGASQGVTAERSSSTLPLLEGWHLVQVRALDRPLRESPLSAAREVYVGVPPVDRAEVAVVGEEVRVSLVDKRGLPVPAAQPGFAAKKGSLGTAQVESGRWVMRWLAPVDGADVLVIDERTFHHEVPLSSEAPRWLWAALGAGGVFNGGAVASFSGSVSVGYRLPLFSRRLGVELRGGVLRGGRRLEVGPTTFDAVAWVVPLSLLANWQQPVGAFVLRGGLGPSLQLAFVSVNEARETRALPGLEVALALGRPLGPGRVEVELGFSYARLDTSLARLDAGGLALRVGYAFDFGPR